MKNLGLYVLAIAIIFIELVLFTLFLVTINMKGTIFNLFFAVIAYYTWNAIVKSGSSPAIQS